MPVTDPSGLIRTAEAVRVKIEKVVANAADYADAAVDGKVCYE